MEGSALEEEAQTNLPRLEEPLLLLAVSKRVRLAWLPREGE